MELVETSIEGVKLITPEAFEDFRGEYVQLWNKKEYDFCPEWAETDVSLSYRGVFKGLHGDSVTTKLISCLFGRFYLVALDMRKDSDTYGQYESFLLSDRNRRQVLVPAGCANGHLCLSDQSIFHYAQSHSYNPARQFTVAWNDPRFNIWFPEEPKIVSQRDEFSRSARKDESCGI